MARLPEHFARKPGGRERLSRETLSEHQRARVLDSATAVFAKQGYTATTIDNIVVAARTNVGSFYGLFDGKEDCFLAVYDRIVGSARERIKGAVCGADGWAVQTYLGLHELLEIVAAEPLAARVALIEGQSAGAAATVRYNAVMDAVIEWLARGRAEHPSAADLPRTFEQAAVAGFAFLLQQRLLAAEPLAVDSLMADTVAMVLEPIVGADELRCLRGEGAATRSR